MADQLRLVERESRPTSSSGCGGPSETVLDKISFFAMGIVFVGVVFAAVGFLYPRDVVRDLSAPARENEKVDLEYTRLSDALNSVIVTGMILIGLGGLILTAIFTNSVVCQKCHSHHGQHDNDAESQTLSSQATVDTMLTNPERSDKAAQYGSVAAESAR